MKIVHRPVLVKEILHGLALQPGAVVLDATVGLGGHAEIILQAIGPQGLLIGVDRDLEALAFAQARLEEFQDQVKLLHRSFAELARLLGELGVPAVDAVLFDLGVSALQLEKPDRGFSFHREGPLDMRMDQTERRTAGEIVQRSSVKELRRLLNEFGEERWASRIARRIVQGRPFHTTTQLAETIRRAVPRETRRGRIDPATRSFQAIRIAVNRELELLPRGLAQAFQVLRPGGRLAVLAYHSLEDRIVKEIFGEQTRQGLCRVVTKKPIRPSPEEVSQNPRARSARLRMAQRLPLPIRFWLRQRPVQESAAHQRGLPEG